MADREAETRLLLTASDPRGDLLTSGKLKFTTKKFPTPKEFFWRKIRLPTHDGVPSHCQEFCKLKCASAAVVLIVGTQQHATQRATG